MKKPIGKKFWRWIPGIVISGIALFILSRFIDIDELYKAIGQYSAVNIIIVIILIILPLGLRALAWKSLLQDISFKDSFLMINEGYFLITLFLDQGRLPGYSWQKVSQG